MESVDSETRNYSAPGPSLEARSAFMVSRINSGRAGFGIDRRSTAAKRCSNGFFIDLFGRLVGVKATTVC